MSIPGRLHLVTDARPGRDTVEVVRATLRAGTDAGTAPVIQVRVEDDVTDRDAYQLARQVARLCREAGATCLVNDRLHIALAVAADGGHVGADDLPVDAARRILGPTAVLGATARDPVSARACVAAGASYLGVGPAFRSPTKPGLGEPLGPPGVAAVASAVDVPVIAIGGITADRVAELRAAGAHGVAVVAAVNAAPDPYLAALELFKALGETR
jgi:thiamine-phosphate pyrophosphorylase